MTKVEKLRLKTYNEAVTQLKKYGKCAIIRPTGFGKTGILTKFIKSDTYKKILYLYPAEVIKQTVLDFYYGYNIKKDSIDNVIFMTYMALTNLSETTLEKLEGTDLIICDECHRLGATETMRGMKDLLSLKSKPHLLGATATPERMDMIDEIALFFNDHVTSRYDINDAFNDHILYAPFYTFCAFGESDPKALAKIKKDTMLNMDYMSAFERKYANELLSARMIEISNLAKMEYVIKSTLEETNTCTIYQKYIVFFKDFAHMRKAKKNVIKWFKLAFPTHTINELIISSETNEYKKNVDKLDTMSFKENHIDLIYTCEMLNLGYHVEDLTGILMYRGTYSNIIYSQQLGRVLSSGDTKPKIVFDIVDNIHRKSLCALLSEATTLDITLTEEEANEYKELLKRTNDSLTEEETNRFIELRRKLKRQNDEKLGKINNNIIHPENLIATKYAASYKELIEKTVNEPIRFKCKQAYARWKEKGGDDSILTSEYILSRKAPEAVPLEPFCKLYHVTPEMVIDVMGIK